MSFVRFSFGRSYLAVLSLWVLAVGGVGGCAEEGSAVITLEDPLHLADDATEVFAGADLAALKVAESPLRAPLPTDIVLEGSSGARQDLWLEARDDRGQTLGRARVTVTFDAAEPSSVTATLGAPCDEDLRGQTTCQRVER